MKNDKSFYCRPLFNGKNFMFKERRVIIKAVVCMKLTLAILMCKLVTFICHIFGKRGTVYPGHIAQKIDGRALKKIKYPDFVVAVTGSSGKGSTVAMLAHILEGNGKKVIWNESGSNVKTGIETLILNNTGIFSHKLEADVLLLEVDERYIGSILEPGTITHLAITNITRDQPSRNIHPKVIFDKINECIVPGMTLVLDVDDPFINRIRYSHDGEVITYGVAKTKYDVYLPNYAVDAAYCPSCETKLEYSSYHYGHLGLYKCPRCSFGRGDVDYEASEVDLEECSFKIDGCELKLNKGAFFAVYYTLLAYTIAKEIGIPVEGIRREINEDEMSSKRGKIYELDGRKIEMLESKNENNLSYLQSLNYIRLQSEPKTIVMGFENVSRRYRFNDLSWLWDIEFELLDTDKVEKIFLIGRFKYDVAVRLFYAGIDKSKIFLVEDMSKLLDNISDESKSDIITMVCFDMTGVITRMLKERSQ